MVLGIIIIGATLGTNAVQQGPPMNAAEIWNLALAAKGGRERLRAIHTLAWSSDDSRRTSTAFGGEHYEFVESYPDRVWLWEDYRPGTMGFGAQVWNGGKRLSWTSSNGGKAVAVPWNEEADRFISARSRQHQLLFLLESSVFRPTLRSAVKTSTGPVLVLDVPGFTTVKVMFDEKTSLPRSMAFVPDYGPTGPPASERLFTIEGYTDVDGIKMPARVRELGDLRFILNPKLSPALFEAAPDHVTQRDHWKAFLIK